MRLTVRADSSIRIGNGHITRCLTLVDEIKRQVMSDSSISVDVCFICRDLPGNCIEQITSRGYTVALLPKVDTPDDKSHDLDHSNWLGVDWMCDLAQTLSVLDASPSLMLVDHYSIDAHWHQMFRQHHPTTKLIAIDDLANRALDVDLLLDQTAKRQKDDYIPLTPPHCVHLCGSEYALLNSRFHTLRAEAKHRRSHTRQIQNILVTMGGTDPDNATSKVLTSLSRLMSASFTPDTHIVMGSHAPYLADVKTYIQHYPKMTLHVDTNKMPELMLNADIAIGAAGTTSWERCCLGLPTLMFINATNQSLIANELAAQKAAINLGMLTNVSAQTITEELNCLINQPEALNMIASNAFRLCDGLGASRVSQACLAIMQKAKI